MLAYIDAATGTMIAAAAAGGIAGVRAVARQALSGRKRRGVTGQARADETPPSEG